MILQLPLRESIFIPVVIRSPLTGKRYPERGEVLAALDTGYTGFILIPRSVFTSLELDQLEPVVSLAKTADGREIKLEGNYAVVEVPEIGLRREGLVETAPDIEEILLGIEWLSGVYFTLDGCSNAITLDKC